MKGLLVALFSSSASYDIEGGWIVLYILVLIVVLFIWAYAASEMSFNAEDKGYDKSKYFHICFWLGLPGYLIVLGLKDKTKENISSTQNLEQLISIINQQTNSTSSSAHNQSASSDLPKL